MAWWLWRRLRGEWAGGGGNERWRPSDICKQMMAIQVRSASDIVTVSPGCYLHLGKRGGTLLREEGSGREQVNGLSYRDVVDSSIHPYRNVVDPLTAACVVCAMCYCVHMLPQPLIIVGRSHRPVSFPAVLRGWKDDHAVPCLMLMTPLGSDGMSCRI